MQVANRKLLLRMRLYVVHFSSFWMCAIIILFCASQQADLIVKAPRGQGGSHVGDLLLSDIYM